ncbi:MAG: hypothetical protein WD738_06225 [Pirellulales bacterium]
MSDLFNGGRTPCGPQRCGIAASCNFARLAKLAFAREEADAAGMPRLAFRRAGAGSS